MKKELLSKYNGKYCSIDDIVTYVKELNGSVSRNTVIWNINDLVRQGQVVRVGRGVYGFVPMKQFIPVISEATMRVCSILKNRFKYLMVTITDCSALRQFMNLQPFSTTVVIEAKKSAVNAVLSALREEGVDAYAKKDFPKLEKYISSSQPFLICSELSVNPKLTRQDNYCISSLEKMLVDLVCDEEVYGQYQGEELRNIFRDATNNYAVNYSQILKYAAARKKKDAVQEMLLDTDVYVKIRSLL